MDPREAVRVAAFRGVCYGLFTGGAIALTIAALWNADRWAMARWAIGLAVGNAIMLWMLAEDD